DVQVALGQEAGGEPQLLRHALRVIAHRLVERRGVQVERVEHRPNGLFRVLEPEELEHHLHEFAAGEEVRSGEALGEKREAAARLRPAVLDAVDFDRARIELAEIQEALDQRRLAGSVDSGQSDAGAGLQIKVYSTQHLGAPKALAHPTESNQRL